MKCEEKVGQYCRQAVKLEKYVQYRKCNKCCINCLNPFKKMGRYLVFRSVLGYTECFLKVDFIIGQYHIEEVG